MVRKKVKKLGGRLFLPDGCRLKKTKDGSADFVFICPPYHRLERYESAKNQLSDLKDYDAFLAKMARCCKNVYRVLKPGRFAVFVVGDRRDGKAFRTFHMDLPRLTQKAGLISWDVVIVQNNLPFAGLQAGKVAAKRYTSKIHEYAMVFRKPE